MGSIPAGNIHVSYKPCKKEMNGIRANLFVENSVRLFFIGRQPVTEKASLSQCSDNEIIYTVFVCIVAALMGRCWKTYDSEMQRNPIMLICFAVTGIWGAIS